MLHYMELFVKQASNSFSPLNNFINTDWFHPMEASLKRVRIKRLIFELGKSNPQQFLSPKSSFELKDEDDEEEESDVQIVHDTCSSKETCSENIPDTCVNKSSDDAALMVKTPLRSEDMDKNCLDTDDNVGSSIADEQKNNRQTVLYDPSINTLPIKTLTMDKTTSHVAQLTVCIILHVDYLFKKGIGETEDFGNKQALMVPETNKNPNVTCLKKSMDLLQLKDKPAADDNVFESHVVEDSDKDVFETCVVEDTDSDYFSICDVNNTRQEASSAVFKDVTEIGSSSKRRQGRPVVSVARKRTRRHL